MAGGQREGFPVEGVLPRPGGRTQAFFTQFLTDVGEDIEQYGEFLWHRFFDATFEKPCHRGAATVRGDGNGCIAATHDGRIDPRAEVGDVDHVQQYALLLGLGGDPLAELAVRGRGRESEEGSGEVALPVVSALQSDATIQRKLFVDGGMICGYDRNLGSGIEQFVSFPLSLIATADNDTRTSSQVEEYRVIAQQGLSLTARDCGAIGRIEVSSESEDQRSHLRMRWHEVWCDPFFFECACTDRSDRRHDYVWR